MDELLHHLNTIEMEEGGSLPFLDTKITKKAGGKLDITLYHKQMHTDKYLYFRPHHPTHVKRGRVRCHVHCAAGTERRGGGGPPHESLHEELLSPLLHPFCLYSYKKIRGGVHTGNVNPTAL